MNAIQKAWLKVLGPVVPLVNDKLAKRSGMIGRIGRFFAFGPRQYGFHPINKVIAVTNRMVLDTMALAMHNSSVFKNLSLNGFVSARPFEIVSFSGKIMVFLVCLTLLLPSEFEREEGTTLDYLENKGLNVPYNALNHRVSAHFTEISSIYSSAMMKIANSSADQIKNTWDRTGDKERKLRFARPGYEYIEPHTKA